MNKQRIRASQHFSAPSYSHRVVFLSYSKDELGTPEDKEIALHMLTPGDSQTNFTILAKLPGGRGTIDAPSWSPDSRRVAFVSYHYPPT